MNFDFLVAETQLIWTDVQTSNITFIYFCANKMGQKK